MSQKNVNNIIAGGIAGICEISVTYPFEYAKTKSQLANSNYRGLLNCFRGTWRGEGISGIYRGLSPVLLGEIPKTSFRFTTFNYLQNHNSYGNSLTNGFLAGVLEGICITTPVETIKTKLIKNRDPLISGLHRIVSEQGIRGIYQGVTPTIMKSATNQASRFWFYSSYEDYQLKKTGQDKLSDMEAMTGGVLAGAFSVLVSNPADVIKTQAQAHTTHICFKQVAKNIYGINGWSGFYTGLFPRFLRVAPGQGILFCVYHKISHYLDGS